MLYFHYEGRLLAKGIIKAEHSQYIGSGRRWPMIQLGLSTHLYRSLEPSSITELIMAFVDTNENVGSVFVVERMKYNYYMCNTDIFKQENMLSG